MATPKEKAMFLKTPVLYQGTTLEIGTKIEADHPEFNDMLKQGRLVWSKALAEAKPGAAEEALSVIEIKLNNALTSIEEKDAKIVELTSDNEVLTKALKEANDKIAKLEKPAAK